MPAVPGVTALECTLKIGTVDYTMWITSASPKADKSVTRTPTWGGNAMVHQAAGEFTSEIAGLFNPGGGINTAFETALKDSTPVTMIVNYGAFVRTYTDYLVSAYGDEAPAEGPVTFSATVSGPDIWESVPGGHTVTRNAVEVVGLRGLVRELKGPLFKDLNRELRQYSKLIAADLVPSVQQAVRESRAPQADAMSRTVRVHSDRVPVVVVGKVNPKFKGSRFRGGNTKRRRGALAHGVIYGPLGGRRDTKAREDYYHIPRDESGGALGRSLRTGPLWDEACAAYLRYFEAAARHHGFIRDNRGLRWGGGR